MVYQTAVCITGGHALIALAIRTQVFCSKKDLYANKCAGSTRSTLFSSSTVGWSDFEKKCYTLYVVPNGCRTSIPKFHVFMSHFHLSQGLRKWANFFIFLFIIFKGCTWNKICSLACLKTKTEEKGKTKIVILFFRSKTISAIFWKIIKILYKF